MKIRLFKKTLLLAVGGLFVWWAWKSSAQDLTATADTSMQMPAAVSQVLELEQAKIADLTIIAYIRNSGVSYNLNASQIIYMRQQGVSDAVIAAMLTQPRTALAAPTAQAAVPASQPAPASSMAAAADPPVVTQPAVTYVQTVPSSYYYYPYSTYHGWYPCGWGWYGGGWYGHGRWGGGWRGGGWHGGWRR